MASRSLDAKANCALLPGKEKFYLSVCSRRDMEETKKQAEWWVDNHTGSSLTEAQGRGSTPTDLDLTFYPLLISRVLNGFSHRLLNLTLSDFSHLPISVFPNLNEKKLRVNRHP